MTQHAIPVCMCLCIKSPDRGLPPRLSVKESACNAGDSGLIRGSGRSLGEEMATTILPEKKKIPWTEEPGGLYSPRGRKK